MARFAVLEQKWTMFHNVHSENKLLGNLSFLVTKVHTSANWIFPVSTRSLVSEHTGIECLTTGLRSKISDIWKGAAASRSYLWAAMDMPTCKKQQIQVSNKPFKSQHSTRVNQHNAKHKSETSE